MVLNEHRDKADKYITPVALKLPDTDPNTLTWLSLLFAFLGGLYVFLSGEHKLPVPGAFWFLVLSFFFIFFASYFDALDGKVAKLHKKTTKRGDFLDHAVDRYADLFILLGIALSSYCNVWIGLFAIIGVLMTSYMGTQAQALGIGRNYGGILGRAERQLILTFAPLVQFIIMMLGVTRIWHFTIFEYVMLWFAIAGNATALHRGVAAWKELE